MSERRAQRGDIVELLSGAAGLFPTSMLEALIARLEARK